MRRRLNKHSRLRWLEAATLGLALTLALGFAAHATVRVALMDTICDDNSYRSTLGAIDFTTALQAEMSANQEYEWVERTDLAKAEAEFKLGGLGLIDRFEAVRSGRWVKADWAVFGRISTNSATNRPLELEVVDLEHADVLAATNLTLAVRSDGPFKMNTTDLQPVASSLSALLDHARRVHSRARARSTVALLFLSPSGSGVRLPGFEAEFRNSLAGGTANGQPFHLTQFQRAGAAMDEADLVLSGLAQTDLNAWEKIATYYIWGSYTVSNHSSFDLQTRQRREAKNLEAKLNVWDGKANPRTVTL